MKDIEDLINNKKKYKNAVIQKRFTSKKNTVCYVFLNDKARVLKWYAPGFKKNMQTEYTILKNASSRLQMPTPFELDEKNNVITMSFIVGENLCDLVNNEKTKSIEKQRLVILLSKWFAIFHDHFRNEKCFFIRGDAILRNFIFTDRIWGVDFEESRKGKPIEDISCMCASILSTDPMFTDEKILLCRLFIDSYVKLVKWNLDNINDNIGYALLEKIQWRSDKEKILRKFAQKIIKNGL